MNKTPVPSAAAGKSVEDLHTDDLVHAGFGGKEKRLLEKARETLGRALEIVSAPRKDLIRDELKESRKILAELNLDAVSFIANTLYPVFLIRPEAMENSEDFTGEFAKIFNCFRFFSADAGDSEEERSEMIHQLVLAANYDLRAVFVVMADWMAKLRLVDRQPTKHLNRIASQCLHVFAPFAHRLGLYAVKNELETLSFSVLDPAGYEEVVSSCSEIQNASNFIIGEFGEKIRGMLESQNVKLDRIEFRNKLPYSIYRKARKKNVAYRELEDLVACRIITEDKMDCYKALGVLHGSYLPVEGRFKDYITVSKPNGYSSLHTTVMTEKGRKFEVQIRTGEMHRIAEKGVAAHWAYKSDAGFTQDNGLLWLRELASRLQKTDNPRETFSVFNRELYWDTVYVFTPKGKIVRLPQQATVIDFAYSIHSEIGDRCYGGRINGVMKTIRTVLQNGDQVEVLTHRNSRPKASWLKHTVSNKAQQRIRSHLKELAREKLEEQGRQILSRELKRFRLTLEKLEEDDSFRSYLEKNGLSDLDELAYELGTHRRGIASVMQVLHPARPPSKKPERQGLFERLAPGFRDSKFKEAEAMPIRFAQCCQPIHGDEVVGIAAASKSINVHKKDCPVIAPERVDEQQLIELEWEEALPKRKNLAYECLTMRTHKPFDKLFKLIESLGGEIVEREIAKSRDATCTRCKISVNFPDNESERKFEKKKRKLGNVALIEKLS